MNKRFCYKNFGKFELLIVEEDAFKLYTGHELVLNTSKEELMERVGKLVIGK